MALLKVVGGGQSCPWIGLTHGLGWIGYGSIIFGFSGLGWVLGPQVHLAVGWVGLGQLFGGLSWVWVDEMDPWTTLEL